MNPARPLLAVLLLAGCGVPRASPAWVDRLGYRPDEVFPLRTGEFGGPRIQVELDGTPVELVFDTGNMTGLSLSPAVAERLRLAVVGEWRSVDADGARLGTRPVFRVREVSVFGRTWRDEKAHGLGDDRLDGLLGPRFLRGMRYTVDCRSGLLAASRSPIPPGLAGGETLRWIRAPNLEGMIVVEGRVAGTPTLVQIDTGKSRTCVDPGFAESLGLPRDSGDYRVGPIRLGSLEFAVERAKPVGFRGISEGLPRPIGVGLGMDVLGSLVLTVDERAGWVALARSARAPGRRRRRPRTVSTSSPGEASASRGAHRRARIPRRGARGRRPD